MHLANKLSNYKQTNKINQFKCVKRERVNVEMIQENYIMGLYK